MAYPSDILGDPVLRWRVMEDGAPTEVVGDAAGANNALDYGDKLRDRELLEDFTVTRYATGIKRADDTSDSSTSVSSTGGYDTYVQGDTEAAIRVANKFEIVPSGTYTRVIEERANLFSHPRQRWTFAGADGESNDDVEALVAAHRKAGGAAHALTRWDKAACAINASVLRVSWRSAHLAYETIRPTALRIQWPGSIIEGGANSDEDRAPVYTDIEDALAVGIELRSATSVGQASTWMCYMGRSTDYPDGRCVTYEARQWELPPKPGAAGIVDEWQTPGGDVANPLTWLQNQHPTDVLYEYPVVVLYGSDGGTDQCVLPVSTSLYSKFTDLDSANSRNLTAASKASTGTLAIEDPGNAGLPETTEGHIALRREQKVSQVGASASNSKDASEVFNSYVQQVAEAEGVPGYTVIAGGKAPESAAALVIRSEPAKNARARRVKLNMDAVEKLTSLELYLIALHSGVEHWDVVVSWDAGEYVAPIPQELRAKVLSEAKAAGYIDHVEAVRDYHGFDTRDEAKDYLRMLEADADEFGTGDSTADKVIGRLKPRVKPALAAVPGGDEDE
ncbi:MAG: DUF2460 domain-containing protein [bacterium]|nr:DUF2460 domain-containing protein [bacterium]